LPPVARNDGGGALAGQRWGRDRPIAGPVHREESGRRGTRGRARECGPLAPPSTDLSARNPGKEGQGPLRHREEAQPTKRSRATGKRPWIASLPPVARNDGVGLLLASDGGENVPPRGMPLATSSPSARLEEAGR